MISVSILKRSADAIHANNQSRVWVKGAPDLGSFPAVRIEAGTIVAHKAHA